MRKIFHNLQYKITAFILAGLLWYLVQGEEVLEINRKIQVNLSVPAGYMIKGSRIRTKDATLSGPRAVLSDFSSRPLEARIQIPPGKTGDLRFRIDKEFIPNWNPRIRLTVHDAYITVYVDEQLKRTVPIKENLQGIPADGFIIEKTILEPKKVEVKGLKSVVSHLKHLLVEPVDLTGLQKSTTFELGLQTQDYEPLELSVDHVTLAVQVGEKKLNKRFESIPIELEGQQYLTQIRPNYVSIVIQGTPGVLNFIKQSDLRAFVDVRLLTPGHYEKKVQVKIPSDTALIETQPELAVVDVDVRVRKPMKRP